MCPADLTGSTDAPARPVHFVGERVQVRPREYFTERADPDGIIEIGDEIFIEPMFAHCGKWARITGRDAFGSFLIDLDEGGLGWSGKMFEDSPESKGE